MTCAREEFVDGGVRVVHLDGCATDADLGASLTTLRAHTGPTILDLADVTLVGSGLQSLLDGLIDSCDAVCITARRQTARVILHRSGVADHCAVFGTVADALQSLRLADEGYGAGWRRLSGAAR